MACRLTIITCTRNRADKLKRCLATIEEALPPQGEWELLVVDNGSSDHTKDVAAGAASHGKIPLTYCFESQIGLSFARNCGLAQASGRIIAYTDDDCLVDKSWPRTILSEFDQDPDLDILGGRVDLADVRDLPFCTRPFLDRCPIVSINLILERLIGCNMAFRRSVFDLIGLFDTRLGAGTSAASSEDTDLFYRALQAGMKISYSPDAIVLHAHGRTAAGPLDPIHYGYAKGRGALYCKHLLKGDWQIAKHMGQELFSLCCRLGSDPAPEPTTYPPKKVLCSLFAGAISRLSNAA